jgi:hypothetical protein
MGVTVAIDSDDSGAGSKTLTFESAVRLRNGDVPARMLDSAGIPQMAWWSTNREDRGLRSASFRDLEAIRRIFRTRARLRRVDAECRRPRHRAYFGVQMRNRFHPSTFRSLGAASVVTRLMLSSRLCSPGPRMTCGVWNTTLASGLTAFLQSTNGAWATKDVNLEPLKRKFERCKAIH